MMQTEITGLAELARRLRELPAQLQAQELRAAVAAGAEVIRADAVRRAPQHTGALKASIYKAPLPDESTATRETWVVNVRRRAFYARFVEYGTIKMSARPFMRPAWDAGKAGALEAIRDRLARAVERMTKRAA